MANHQTTIAFHDAAPEVDARHTASYATMMPQPPPFSGLRGKVAYAVVSFGGFLGMGEDYYPMPWPNLKYDANLSGYRVGIIESQLKAPPSTIATLIGIGPTGPEIKKYTTTTARHCGTSVRCGLGISFRGTGPMSLVCAGLLRHAAFSDRWNSKTGIRVVPWGPTARTPSPTRPPPIASCLDRRPRMCCNAATHTGTCCASSKATATRGRFFPMVMPLPGFFTCPYLSRYRVRRGSTILSHFPDLRRGSAKAYLAATVLVVIRRDMTGLLFPNAPIGHLSRWEVQKAA